MSFKDDEEIKVPDVSAEEKRIVHKAGKIQVIIDNKPEAPLEETKLDVVVELTGSGDNKDRPGVDLVTVIDVSGSMGDDGKLEKLKIAMQFLIKKLSLIDRLSVVTFADNSKRLFPLRQITENSQKKIIEEVKGLEAKGNTNIAAGLQTALNVLNDRNTKDGRVGAIMLMSDGIANRGKDIKPDVSNFPVHTFGFGANHDPVVLQDFAQKSNGGTFSDVQNQKNLSIAFSQCLAGLLTVVVQDLELTITQFDKVSTIGNVGSGNYPQSRDKDSVTVFFGDLYNKEVRIVMLDLLLPEADTPNSQDALEVTYTYSPGVVGQSLFESNPITTTVKRAGRATEKERDKVIVEKNRNETAKVMKEARKMADKEKLQDAKNMLAKAQKSLENVETDEPSPMVEMLKSEVKQMLELMKSPDIYKRKGRPFALSSETSHDRQRFAARGDDVGETRLFATPRMDAFLKQAQEFDKDPDNAKLPTEKEDIKEEVAADPLGPIIGPLRYYIQAAIQALKSLNTILGR